MVRGLVAQLKEIVKVAKVTFVCHPFKYNLGGVGTGKRETVDANESISLAIEVFHEGDAYVVQSPAGIVMFGIHHSHKHRVTIFRLPPLGDGGHKTVFRPFVMPMWVMIFGSPENEVGVVWNRFEIGQVGGVGNTEEFQIVGIGGKGIALVQHKRIAGSTECAETDEKEDNECKKHYQQRQERPFPLFLGLDGFVTEVGAGSYWGGYF